MLVNRKQLDRASLSAIVAPVQKKGSFVDSSGVSTASRGLARSGGPVGRVERQQGLIMYKLPKTSECFMPIRVAPLDAPQPNRFIYTWERQTYGHYRTAAAIASGY